MIPKRIVPSAWFPDYPTAHLIEVHSKGFDRGPMQKRASADYIMAMDLRPEPGKSFMHLITTGAGEYYGPNNNAYYFNEKTATF